MHYTPRFHIVLWRPEIPNNTGNIGRTCVALEAQLHLIGPLGFDISDKAVRRAGLDYWSSLKKELYSDWESFLQKQNPKRLFVITTQADQLYFEPQFQPNDYFLFGQETQGLPPEIIDQYPKNQLRIPMLGPTRSLNLANATAIIGYEVLRQSFHW